MEICLKEINQSNWKECILLTTNKDNNYSVIEEFVASNLYSIAQSRYEKGWNLKAIYADDTMIGLTMYGYCYEYEIYEIGRIMIDHKYQNRGYGKIILKKIIDEMKKIKECKELFLTCNPRNLRAKNIYESFGFEDTGKYIKDEILYILRFK